MALLEPLLALKLVDCLKNGLGTYTVCSMWVSEIACEINLMRLYLLEKLDDDVDVCL